jgi:hypothetical protein
MVLRPESGRTGQNHYLWLIDTWPGFCPNRRLYGGRGQIHADIDAQSRVELRIGDGVRHNRPQQVLEFRMRAAIPAHTGMVRGKKADVCTAQWNFR